MKIREIRLKKGLSTSDVITKLHQADTRVTGNVYYLLEEGICLPTVEQFHILCRAFRVKAYALATREEISFRTRSKRQHKENKELYQLHSRVPRLLTGTTEELHHKLVACGYGNIANWLMCCMVALNAEYEKNRRDAGTSAAAKQEN